MKLERPTEDTFVPGTLLISNSKRRCFLLLYVVKHGDKLNRGVLSSEKIDVTTLMGEEILSYWWVPSANCTTPANRIK